MKKVLCIMMAVFAICLAIVPVEASAARNEPVPYFTAINSIYSLLQIDRSTGIATCVGEVQAKELTPVEVVVQLQRLENGTWNTLVTWTNTGTFYATKSGSYCVPKGYSYRTKVTGLVYDSTGNIIESGSGSHVVDYF